MNIVKAYVDSLSEMYHRLHPEIMLDVIRPHVEEYVMRSFRDIPCVMRNNTKHETHKTSMTSVIEWIEERNPIITGNGTFFMQHAEYKAPIIDMLEQLKIQRSGVKKEMFSYQKGSINYINLDIHQGNIKVIMNADYGGSGTPYSAFYSLYIPPATTGTAKNITTTLICCLEFISGNNNKWVKLKDINELFDMIRIVLNDTENRELIHDVYTVDEVLKYLVSRILYCVPMDVAVIRKYLETLEPNQLTKLMLAFNAKLVLTRYLSGEVGILAEYMRGHQLNFDQPITKEILFDCGFGVNPPDQLIEIFEHVKKVVIDNCCYGFILNDVETRSSEMTREVVCVTDTDSLMVHFASYVDVFQTQSNEFRDACLMATAIGLRLFVDNGGIIPKMVEYVAKGCNINDEYYRKKFKFKNEFGFLAMALVAKKMYASSCFVQEGAPRDIHKIEVSGMSFKKRDAAEFLGPLMIGLYDHDVLTTKRIHVESILDKYYDLRQMILDNIDKSTTYYRVQGLKHVNAYEKSSSLPEAMRGALIWNAINPDEEMQPMDRVTIITLSWDLLMQHQNDDPRIAKLKRYNEMLSIQDSNSTLTVGCTRQSLLVDNENMSKDPVICIPENYTDIPEWIKPCIDKEGTCDKLLNPFKQVLSLFDVYMADTKNGMIASRMVCI